ncbi:MAG: CBS domain-containing protein [bacterium]
MESIKTKMELIRLFLKYPISSIPIVDEKRKILGFLSKQDIIASSGMKDDINLPIANVIEYYLNPIDKEKDIHFLNLLLKNFNKIKKLPIMDSSGNIVDMWERFELIAGWEGEENKEKKGLYSKLFDHLPVGVVITSELGKILYLNPSASSISNTKGKKIGRDFKDVFNVKIEPPASRKKEGNFTFDAGYIKEDNKVEGAIYIIACV